MRYAKSPSTKVRVASHIVRGMMVCALAISGLAGCVPVDARGDFGQAAQLVTARTDVAEIYDPANEEAIATRVQELLSGGLTIDEAVRVAMLNNRELQETFAEIGVSRADLVQSKLWTNPTLSLGFALPEGGGLTDFTLGFAQQITDFWQIPVKRRVAERQLERTVALAAQRAIVLRAQVRTQCFEVLALRRSLELVDRNVELADRVTRAASQQFDAGQVSEFDVNRTRISRLDAQAERVSTQGALASAEAALGDLLGLARYGESWRLEDELPDGTLSVDNDDALLLFALDRRLDARAAELDVQAAEQELELQVRRVFPDLQLGFALERNERRAMPGRKILADTARTSIAAGQLTAPAIESRGQRSLARSQIIDAKLGPSLAVTLPLWDQNQAQIAKARFRALQARKRYIRTLDAIAVQVSQAAIQVNMTAELIRLYRDESIPAAESTVDGATRLYDAGEQSVLVLVDAQEQFVQRRRDFVQALRDHAAAVAELENAVGGELPDIASAADQVESAE